MKCGKPLLPVLISVLMRREELQSITKNSNTYSFTYNLNGLRTKKSINGNNTFYYYDDSNNLIGLKKGNTTVLFYYDSEGQIYSMSKGEDTYFFVKTLQGDITKIIDENGTTAATYAYDAWGKLLSENENSAIEGLNPFRYRGYVYDEETELYYLQSRYYDPITGRFLNLDNPEFSDTGSGTPLSTNMFAYCENNPISGYDPSGEDAYWLQAPSDANGFGHTSLLLQEGKNKWWYFYWGDHDIQLLYFGSKSLSKLNLFLHGVKQRNGTYTNKWKHNFYPMQNYTHTALIKGDFRYCLDYIYYGLMNLAKHSKYTSYAFSLKNKKFNNYYYNVRWKNCMQVVVEVLLRGEFKNGDVGKRKILKHILRSSEIIYCIPNSVFFILKRMHFFDK